MFRGESTRTSHPEAKTIPEETEYTMDNNYDFVTIDITDLDHDTMNVALSANSWSSDQELVFELRLESERDPRGRAIISAHRTLFSYSRYISIVDDDLILTANLVMNIQGILGEIVRAYVAHNNENIWRLQQCVPDYEDILFNVTNSDDLAAFVASVVRQIRESESK